jgi:hypothetical protein
LPELDDEFEPPPELEHPAKASASAPTPAATARGTDRRDRRICVFTGIPLVDG